MSEDHAQLRPIVLIDGWWGSGKSVLRGLLDGHRELFVCPIQDSIPGALARDWESGPWLDYRDTEQLRKLLASLSQYYRIERFGFNRRMHLDFSRQDRAYIDIDLDFARFDALWMGRLIAEPKWDYQLIAQHIYAALLECWNRYPFDRDAVRYFTTMDNNRQPTPRFFLERFDTGKMLYTFRDAAGIIATRAGRTPVKEDFRTEKFETLTVDALIERGEAREITERRAMVRDLAERYPDRLLIIEFEPLIEDTESTMRRVAEFLQIEWTESLAVFSHMGEEVTTGSGMKYVGKIHDRSEDLLTANQLARIAKDVELGRGEPHA